MEGELISKMGKPRLHVNTVTVVHAWLVAVFGVDYVNPAAPIDVDPADNPTSEPEPDLIVLTRRSREFRDANPSCRDIRLVIEISDTTVGYDLTTKAGLYARAGIPEYWVFDIEARRLVVHREPRNGSYQAVVAYGAQESVSPLVAPGSELRVGEAFGD